MSILPSPQSDAEFWRIHAGTLAERIETLFDAIAHGDEEHRAWLKEAIDCHILAKPIPPVRGKGNKQEMRAVMLSVAADLESEAKNLSPRGLTHPAPMMRQAAKQLRGAA